MVPFSYTFITVQQRHTTYGKGSVKEQQDKLWWGSLVSYVLGWAGQRRENLFIVIVVASLSGGRMPITTFFRNYLSKLSAFLIANLCITKRQSEFSWRPYWDVVWVSRERNVGLIWASDAEPRAHWHKASRAREARGGRGLMQQPGHSLDGWDRPTKWPEK